MSNPRMSNEQLAELTQPQRDRLAPGLPGSIRLPCRRRATALPTRPRESHDMTYNPQRALELLRIGCGRPDANFREGQEDAIRHIVDGRRRT